MTPLDFVLILGAALSLHRIWNYEPICARVRGLVANIKPLGCPACNAFWIAIGVTVIGYFTSPFVLIPLASFFPVRVMMWAYDWKPKPKLPMPVLPPKAMPTLPKPVPYTRTVVMMTALTDVRSSYSVAQASTDIARGIATVHPDWDVQVWTTQMCKTIGTNLPANVQHRSLFPNVKLEPDVEDASSIAQLSEVMQRELSAMRGPVSVITQDLLFISWFLNYAKAIHSLPDFSNIRWWHMCHSSTSGNRGGAPLARVSMPSGSHTIVTVAENGIEQFKALYQTPRVVHIPNIRDPRTMGLSEAVQTIVTKQQLWQARIVQILPACSTRLEAKGFARIAKVFAYLNRYTEAQLIVCNPNAVGDKANAVLARIKEQAAAAGLPANRWCLTSEILPSTAYMGLPTTDIADLMNLYGNTLVLPSHAEADSLVVLEARLARQFIVTNGDVPNMTGGDVMVFWGPPGDASKDAANAEYAGNRILQFFAGNKTETSRRDALMERNLEVIGNRWATTIASAGLLTG